MSPTPTSLLDRARDLVRFTAHETDTEEGRARERYRRATLGSLSSLVARVASLTTSLASVPLTLSYLGRPRYGLWNTIAALLTWAALMDFGLGRGLINHLSDAHGKDDRHAAGQVVSTGLLALSGIAVLAGVVFLPVWALVPWNRVFNVTDPSLQGETSAAVATVVAIFIANFPLSAVNGMYAAYQRSYVANLFAAGASVASLALLYAVTRAHGGLPMVIFAAGGVSVTMNLLTLAYILRDMPWLRPSRALVSRETLRSLASVSLPMLLFQLGSLMINELQLFVIAHRMGLGSVADYTIYLKVFAAPVMLVAMVDSPMAPAFREAVARGDFKWVRDAFWRTWWIKCALCLLAAAFYLYFGDLSVFILTREHAHYDRSVWALAGVLLMVGCWNGSFNNLLIAFNRLWLLVIAILLNGVVTASLTWVLAGRYGFPGIIAATIAYSLFVTGWLFPAVCWRWIGPKSAARP